MDRTAPSEGADAGSIPAESTKRKTPRLGGVIGYERIGGRPVKYRKAYSKWLLAMT